MKGKTLSLLLSLSYMLIVMALLLAALYWLFPEVKALLLWVILTIICAIIFVGTIMILDYLWNR